MNDNPEHTRSTQARINARFDPRSPHLPYALEVEVAVDVDAPGAIHLSAFHRQQRCADEDPDDVEVIMVGPDQGVEALFLPTSTGAEPAPTTGPAARQRQAGRSLDRLQAESVGTWLCRAHSRVPRIRTIRRKPGQDRIEVRLSESIWRTRHRIDRRSTVTTSAGSSPSAPQSPPTLRLRQTPDCMVFIVPPASIGGFARVRRATAPSSAIRSAPISLCRNSMFRC